MFGEVRQAGAPTDTATAGEAWREVSQPRSAGPLGPLVVILETWTVGAGPGRQGGQPGFLKTEAAKSRGREAGQAGGLWAGRAGEGDSVGAEARAWQARPPGGHREPVGGAPRNRCQRTPRPLLQLRRLENTQALSSCRQRANGLGRLPFPPPAASGPERGRPGPSPSPLRAVFLG